MSGRGSVGRPSVPRALGSLGGRVADIESGLGLWNYPELLNGWVNASEAFSDPRFADVAYRRGVGPQAWEFKGMATGGASGTVMFVLLEDFWPDQVLTHVVDVASSPDPTAAFQTGRLFVDPDNGEATIVFPAS